MILIHPLMIYVSVKVPYLLKGHAVLKKLWLFYLSVVLSLLVYL
tara:strand:- start:6 stop:137 length:132 start_codon:yes stop_codon:yes gene_type:complete